MLQFIAQLRELSGGKPVGIKLCVGHPGEWLAIVKAMLQTGQTPDFVVVDGAEGGTGAAPIEFADHVGMPLRDGLRLVHNSLVGAGLRDRVRIGASGKVISAFDIARCLALGADWCNSARGFMFALGCIQSRSCHTDHCPTGVATQDPVRQRAIVVTKFSGVYQVAYLGFGFAYEPPSVHPYPLIIGASHKDASLRFSSTSGELRFPVDPAPGTCLAYYPDSAWRQHSNRSGVGDTEGSYDVTNRGKVWPSCYVNSTEPFNYIRDNIDASRPLLPAVLYNESPVHHWGEFDGLYWATGYSTSSEAVIRERRIDHLVVQNVFRTGQKDFAAVALD